MVPEQAVHGWQRQRKCTQPEDHEAQVEGAGAQGAAEAHGQGHQQEEGGCVREEED